MHATHTVHALPELRVAGGRLGDGVSVLMAHRTDFALLAGRRPPTKILTPAAFISSWRAHFTADLRAFVLRC